MQQITDWLNTLGLSEYAQRFADNGIDLSVLPDLTDQDLEKLGVLLGHRRKMLRAIANLDAMSAATSPARALAPASLPPPPIAVPAPQAVGERLFMWVVIWLSLTSESALPRIEAMSAGYSRSRACQFGP
jgi:hypothetical protein